MSVSQTSPSQNQLRQVQSLAKFFVAIIVLGLVGFTLWWGNRPKPSELAVLFQAPEFTLLNQANQSFGSQNLKGKVYLAHFVFSRCPSVCPRMLQTMQFVHNNLSAESAIAQVSFTVDPSYDRPAILNEVAKKYQADTQRWNFLTGDDSESLLKLYRDGFKVPVEPTQSDIFDIAHAEKIVLVDQQGQIRGYYGHDETAIKQLQIDARHLVDNP